MKSNWQNVEKMVTSTSKDPEINELLEKAAKHFAIDCNTSFTTNQNLSRKMQEINQSQLKYYEQTNDDVMINAYQKELELLDLIEQNVTHGYQTFSGIAPSTKEAFRSDNKMLKFENDQTFLEFGKPWGVRRSCSQRE